MLCLRFGDSGRGGRCSRIGGGGCVGVGYGRASSLRRFGLGLFRWGRDVRRPTGGC